MSSFEQDFLQNELNDEFQLLQNEQQTKPSNSFISILKNLTYSKPKPPELVDQTLNEPNPKIQCAKTMPTNQGLLEKSRKFTADSIKDSGSSKSAKQAVRSKSNSTIATPRLVPFLSLEKDERQEIGHEPKLNDYVEPAKSIEALKVEAEPTLANPYLTLSQEDYIEHKFPILHCKFSKDGKHVASVDSQGIIKSKF